MSTEHSNDDRHERAVYQALGYAWGREDASHVKTSAALALPQRHHPGTTGAFAFATAYADESDKFNRSPSRAAYLPSVSLAYENWQDSAGATVCPVHNGTER
jgi:hypothetical protein